MEELTQLSDPDLLAEAERVRDVLEHGLPTPAGRLALGRHYDALGDEYDRRRAPYTGGQ